jgi:hypothetical protein
MKEQNLHRPRCGELTSTAGGKCVHCGLVVQFTRRALRRARPASPAPRPTPPLPVEEPPARGGRLDVRDRIEAEFGPPEQRVSGLQTGRYDVGDARRAATGPSGGDVEVGGLVALMMDPSENPYDHPPPGETAPLAGGRLELGKSAYGEAEPMPAPEPADPPLEKTAFGDTTTARRFAAPKPDEGPPAEDFGQWRRHARNRHLHTRVLPQVVVLAAALAIGPLFIGGPIVLSGTYDATFSDGEGRQVSCEAQFFPREGVAAGVKGEFSCRLYESVTSTARIQEPPALRLIMGNGNFNFAGAYDSSGVKLNLGGFGGGEMLSVQLTGRFTDRGRRIKGMVIASNGEKAKAELVKKSSL